MVFFAIRDLVDIVKKTLELGAREVEYGEEVLRTDKSIITRKQSKSSKHGHENQKSTKPKPSLSPILS
ncbi:hypothetical protein Tco_0314280 [Tanacetum coccineum]